MFKIYINHYNISVDECLTLSTSRNTRKKFSPANFFKSSNVHIPLANKVVNNSGYFDTSSKPTGAL